MYQTLELARFALSEFERGLDGLTDEDARTRMTKADGTEMNAISWNVGHIARHWFRVAAYARQEQPPAGLEPYTSGPAADPTPPPLSNVLTLLEDAKTSIDWIREANDALLSATRGSDRHGENVGTALMRAVLHTWFHAGEINAVRQMLGHPPIGFVGGMIGNLEWRGEGEAERQ